MLFLYSIVEEFENIPLRFMDLWIQGFDIAEGASVLKAGERLGAAEIGLLATVGVSHVEVKFLSGLTCLKYITNYLLR